MNKTLLLTAIATLLILPDTVTLAQKTTRGKKLNSRTEQSAAPSGHYPAVDTIKGDAAAASVTVTGYEKPLRAVREAFFISNTDSTRTLTQLTLEITYKTRTGDMLHVRTVTVTPKVPPLERRLVTVRSWDRQNVFYYALGDTPRTRSQATPYIVSIRPLSILLTACTPEISDCQH